VGQYLGHVLVAASPAVAGREEQQEVRLEPVLVGQRVDRDDPPDQVVSPGEVVSSAQR
jgi:hypothetical protein